MNLGFTIDGCWFSAGKLLDAILCMILACGNCGSETCPLFDYKTEKVFSGLNLQNNACRLF